MMRRPVRFLWLACMALALGLCACREESSPKAVKESASAVVA